jgi:uncharacterized protein
MKEKLLSAGEVRTYAVVFETGDEVAEGLLDFARRESITGAGLTAIGAFERVTLAFFNLETREYEEIPVEQQVEVLALTGNLGMYRGEPKLHAHLVVGLRDGSTRGGHLLNGHVRPTLEVVVTETPGYLKRTEDAATGLPLIDLDE